MAEGKFAGLDTSLNGWGQLEQAKEVGNGRAVLAGALRHLLLGHMELARKALEGSRLFHRVQIGALQVLDDGDFHRLLIGDLAQDCRHSLLAGQLRGAPAALAGNQLEAAASQGTNKDGLNYAVCRDGCGQLGELILIHGRAGLEGVVVDEI